MTQKESMLQRLLRLSVKPLITIAVSLAIGALLILNAGQNPLLVYAILFKGAFGTSTAFLGTLGKATPLIFTGLAASVAAQVGVFNIGIEGQLYMGALAAGVVGANCGALPALLAVPLCLLAAMAAAAVWALIPGLLNNKLGVNIFIMFFMLNNMAQLFTEYLSNGPFKGNLPDAATGKMTASARLIRFSPFADLSVGILIALALVAVCWFVMKKTRFGYECSALGLNPRFSEYIGVKVGGVSLTVLLISAMIAGLAGAEPVMGSMGRFYANFSNNLGFTGVSIGLLASNNPMGVVVFAVFFGALTNGGLQMAASAGLPGDLINVLQSLMIILISADFILRAARPGKAARKGAVG